MSEAVRGAGWRKTTSLRDTLGGAGPEDRNGELGDRAQERKSQGDRGLEKRALGDRGGAGQYGDRVRVTRGGQNRRGTRN
ncbi:hypothetical protein EYF80_019561 [Liparis tanakae]|uniref:Uncharacterized protein n=1 Tax=Liparis tanakae TaxID=230148 RepID=A0A4Z2HXB9_9TELE|nr:hypothetical protein EYF80_019561 [Liparis tanakae]